jgi:hypothetical protein
MYCLLDAIDVVLGFDLPDAALPAAVQAHAGFIAGRWAD